MNIEEMSRKDFERLPYIDGGFFEVDSVVLLPTRRKELGGYRVFEVVPCLKWNAYGRLYGYDTFSVFADGEYERVGIDFLNRSGLARVFLQGGKYIVDCTLHSIIKKRGVK